MISLTSTRRIGFPQLGIALALPVATMVVQSQFWNLFQPFAWFLFYPAVFIAALIGGLWGGIGATVLSTVLVGFYFLPTHMASLPQTHPSAGISAAVFLATGILFSFVNEKIRALDEKMAKAAGESRYRILFDQASDGIVCLDSSGRYREANPAFCRMMGYSREEILAMDAYQLLPATQHERLKSLLATPTPTVPGVAEWPVSHRDGSNLTVEASMELLFDGTWIAIVRDVSQRAEAEARLHAAFALNQAVMDSVTSQVAVVDRNGAIVAANKAWVDYGRRYCGTPERLAKSSVGANFLKGCGGDIHCDGSIHRGLRDVLAGRSDHFQHDGLCESHGKATWFAMNVTPLASAEGGAVISYLDISDVKRAQDLEHRANLELKTLAAKQLVFQEEERRTLSRELHDHVSQDLAALQLALDTCTRQSKCDTKVQEPLLEARHIADSILETTRDISRRLRPPLLDDLGLAPALRWHIDKLPRADKVGIRIHENIGTRRFAADIELACFRVTQEALTNALRHAQAQDIVVSLEHLGDTLAVAVNDDGQGFDAALALEHSRKLNSLGLLGMRERVAGIGGEFHIESTPGAGTVVCASFNLPVTVL